MDGNEEIESLQERITGRYLCENIEDKDGNILVKANHMVTPKRAELIMKKGVDPNGNPLTKIKIRTILTCRSHNGICAKCYGANMATGEPVQVSKIRCGYNILQGRKSSSTVQVYLLRRDGDGHWKIYGWDLAENLDGGKQPEGED